MIEKDKGKGGPRSPIPTKKRGVGLQIRGKRSRGPSTPAPATGNIPFPNFPSAKLQPIYVPVSPGSNELKVIWGVRTIESTRNFDVPSIISRVNELIAAARGQPANRARGLASKYLTFRIPSLILES